MGLGKRTLLWAGAPCRLIQMSAGLLSWSVLSVEQGPMLAESDHGQLMEWLSSRLPRGACVDVVYQRHLLQLEAFPTLAADELVGVLEGKLRRDAILPVEHLFKLIGRHDATGFTQGAFAGVMKSSHSGLRQALVATGLRLGRVAFAGQLAFRAFAHHGAVGEWVILDQIAFEERVLFVKGADGQVSANSMPVRGDGPPGSDASRPSTGAAGEPGGLVSRTGPTAAEVVALIKVFFPRLSPAAQGLDVASRFRRPAERLVGQPLPSPLSWVIPTFLADGQWRVASEEDVEYPYYFGLATWAFVVAVLLMIGYSGYLYSELSEQRTAKPILEALTGLKQALASRQRLLDADQQDLNYLEANVVGVSVELYDNAAWLKLIAEIRDKYAPPLLFSSVSYTSPALRIAGQHPTVDPILAFFKHLVQAVGEKTARLEGITRVSHDRHSFAITIARTTAAPPAAQE